MKLTIANTDIHQDAEGRFSLNDLHRAAGGEDRHQPALFLRLQQTQDLIAAIYRSTDSQIGSDAVIPASTDGGIPPSPLSVKKGGAHQGSYGVKELVYAYANWISADFYLQMIRTFDAVATGKVGAGGAALHPPRLFPDYFKVARLIGCDRNAAALSANQAVLQKTGENVLALLGQTHMEAEKQDIYFNVSDLVDGISGQRMNKMLSAAGLQTREGEQWAPTADGKDFCRIFDTGKRHGSGAPITAIKWSREVLSLLTLGEAAA